MISRFGGLLTWRERPKEFRDYLDLISRCGCRHYYLFLFYSSLATPKTNAPRQGCLVNYRALHDRVLLWDNPTSGIMGEHRTLICWHHNIGPPCGLTGQTVLFLQPGWFQDRTSIFGLTWTFSALSSLHTWWTCLLLEAYLTPFLGIK